MDGASAIPNLKVQVNNRQILSIAMPITLAILIPQLNMLTNSIFLGRLSTEALGDAGITSVFYLIFAVMGNGLNNSMQSVFSKYAGADKPEFFKIIFSQGLRLSVQFAVAGILFTWLVAPYIMQAVADPRAYPVEMNFLRIRIFGLPFLFFFQMCNAFLVATLNSRYLMIGFIMEACCNIFFDYGLIFGKMGMPAMGFNGAAVASIIAEAIGMFTVIAVLYATHLKKQYGIKFSFTYHRNIHKEVLRVSVPLVLQYFISVTTWLVFFLLIERHGEMAKAISNTMRNVFGLAGVFVWAFAATSNNMVSNLIGQQKPELVLKAINRIMLWSLGFAILICGTLNLFPQLFFGMFGQGPEFIKEGIPVIRTVTLGIVFMSVSCVWLNAVTGTGKTKMNLAIELVAISLYMAYTWYFLVVNYINLATAWTNEFIYWLSILLMASWYMRSKRWIKQKVVADE